MSAQEVLARLQALGVDLSADQGRLRINAQRGQIDDEMRAAIARHKPELLNLLANRGGEAPLVLSAFQERLWILNRLNPQDIAYNIISRWLSPGPVDADRLRSELLKLFARHDVLRTVFSDAHGVVAPRQVAPEAIPLLHLDLRGQPEASVRSRVQADTDAATRRPFDLATEPPIRATVYRLDEDHALVMFAVHHIAADAWSMGLLGKEIMQAFAGLSPVRNAFQYADFARWQRSVQGSAETTANVEWWVKRLAQAPELSAFAPDANPTSQFAGATYSDRWSEQLSEAVRLLSRQNGATTYMVMLATIATVLHLHTGQTDVVLGNPMGVREKTEHESVVGPFVNLLMLRLDLSGNPSFSELLRRTRDVALDAYEHRHVPFERLLELLHPVRSLTRSPLFQMALVQHGGPQESAADMLSNGSMHELTWFARDAGAHFEHSFEYRSDLYSPQLIERISRQLRTVLAAAVADPQVRLSEMALLDDEQRRQVVEDFNDTARALDTATFIEQFERQALITPDACAVSFDGEQLSYATLDAQAQQLARHLRSQGAKRGALLALCLERTLLLPVALLAIQKTGAAYLPLDPAFPAERLAYMLQDSGTSLLVGTMDVLTEIQLPPGVVIVDLAQVDLATPPVPDARDSMLAERAVPNDTAYMIYTSGSTGRPKGVVISHAGLSNFLGSMAQEPGLSAADVVAAITTIAFDISTLELYLPWIRGARVDLVSRETAQDGGTLAAHLAEVGATVVQATPATWRMLLATDWRAPAGFRAFCGGEALSRDVADALIDRGAELWNLYGPTETTVWSTLQKIEHSPAPVTVGRPIANTRIYVVDSGGRPRPVGMAGEIWIGGTGVALGYHCRAELTAERFVADRISGDENLRLYRTGDLGQWDERGRLQHLGRIDHQVKIRGYRIETGEIEAVLGEHRAIRQAIVVAREPVAGDVRLVAYVVFEANEELTVSEVRRHLRKLLPDYMVPSLVVVVESVPLTPNGKVDRSALPDPFRQSAAVSAQHEAPATRNEKLVAEIWSSILQAGSIGAHDNFFDLGGHSLLTLRVVADLESQTGWRMDPRMLFFQTLRQIAAQLEQHEPVNTTVS